MNNGDISKIDLESNLADIANDIIKLKKHLDIFETRGLGVKISPLTNSSNSGQLKRNKPQKITLNKNTVLNGSSAVVKSNTGTKTEQDTDVSSTPPTKASAKPPTKSSTKKPQKTTKKPKSVTDSKSKTKTKAKKATTTKAKTTTKTKRASAPKKDAKAKKTTKKATSTKKPTPKPANKPQNILEDELAETLTPEEIDSFQIERVDMDKLTHKVCALLIEHESDGMLQADLYKRLKLSARNGARLSLKLERMGTVSRIKILENERWTYKLMLKKTPVSTDSLTGAPCLTCSVEQRCSVDGEVSPMTCPYIEDWVLIDLKRIRSK